jgi:hypothetical protein
MANNLAAFNTQAFSKLLIKNLDQINVMLPLVNRDYEGEFQNIGDTVNVRTLGSITTGTWSTNGTISYQDLAPVTEAMTISDAQYFAFKVDDVNVAQNDIDALAKYAKRAAVQISNVIEAKLLSGYASVLTANKITGGSSAAITLDSSSTALVGIYPVIVEAGVRLDLQNVPQEGRWFVVDPATYALLLNDTTHFIRATDLGDRIVTQGTIGGGGRPGFVGQCAGFDIYKSNAVPQASSAKYLQYGTPMAISYAAQIREVEVIRLETTFATAVRGLLLHGTKVFAEASKAYGYVKATA